MTETITDLVSTIIPVYNRPEMVKKAVRSVLDQTYRPIEIILVNDGSNDNTAIVLNNIANEHPSVVTVIHQENSGAGIAREAGRLIARGEYIQYLDSDDWLLPRKFEVQVKALQEHPDCEIAYCASRLIDQTGRTIKEPSKWTGRRIDYLFPSLLVDRWWHTHTPLFRRSISDAAGAWPKQRPEDWDLEARMGELKAKLIFCDETLSCQLDHAGEGRVSQGDMGEYIRDEAWFLPRLYECAIKAGVKKNTPEMNHFSRWAFMRARQLGAMGEAELAKKIIILAKKSAIRKKLSIYLVSISAIVIGWRATGILCSLIEDTGDR